MKKILVLSGKGGTGKTTVAASLIKYLDSKILADCDVDAPNLHILLDLKAPIEKDFIGSQKAKINEDKCIGCGKCQENCRFEAISKNGKIYQVDEIACEGCGMCEIVCPVDAVSFFDDVSGIQQKYNGKYDFSTARLRLGRGNSGKLVSAVKKDMGQSKTESYAVLDGSPGIGCPVIASISGVDWVLLVAEPTLSGFSDLRRIVNTCRSFDTKMALCVNKADINSDITKQIMSYCVKENIDYLGGIPYDKMVINTLKAGKLIIDIPCPASDALSKVYHNLKQLLDEGKR